MAEILLVGRDLRRAGDIRGILRKDGHRITRLKHVAKWREAEIRLRPEVVVAAVDSVHEVIDVRGRRPPGFPAPLLVVQHETDFFQDLHLDDRLVDRMSSPFMGEDLQARVDALVRVRRVIQRVPTGRRGRAAEQQRRSSLLGRLSSLFGPGSVGVTKPDGPYLEVAARVAHWSDRRDAFEPGHPERVTSLCASIAEALGLDEARTDSLLRAATTTTTTTTEAPAEPTIADIVVELASGDPAEFTILLAAVQAADPAVIEALSDPEQQLTVFAPTDEAFAAALEALGLTAEELLASPDLTNILLYHVAPGVFLAADVVAAAPIAELPTLLEGSTLSIEVVDGSVVINETATVVQPDVVASNGVIHVIDAVLLP